MKKIILFLFLTSCSPLNSNINSEVLRFNDNLSFNEFTLLLKKYVKNTPYPKLNK